MLFSGHETGLRRLGLGRLPADFSFRLGGGKCFVPLAGSLLLNLLAVAVATFI